MRDTTTAAASATGLSVDSLHAWYGASHVLQGVSLEVRAGAIVALLGRNGVGRSTLAKAIMGYLRTRGEIRLAGRSTTGLRTHEIARAGLGYVPESRDVFPTLTVEQNLILGLKGRRPGRWGLEDAWALFPRLEERRGVVAGVLSGGEQQMLALSRALMGDPSVLIVDEPTEGVAPQIVRQIAAFLERLRDRGVGILLIEQKLAMSLEISDRVAVMGHGRIVFEGTPSTLADAGDVRRDWLGV